MQSYDQVKSLSLQSLQQVRRTLEVECGLPAALYDHLIFPYLSSDSNSSSTSNSNSSWEYIETVKSFKVCPREAGFELDAMLQYYCPNRVLYYVIKYFVNSCVFVLVAVLLSLFIVSQIIDLTVRILLQCFYFSFLVCCCGSCCVDDRNNGGHWDRWGQAERQCCTCGPFGCDPCQEAEAANQLFYRHPCLDCVDCFNTAGLYSERRKKIAFYTFQDLPCRKQSDRSNAFPNDVLAILV
jgi:hypothetical protein